MARTVQRRKGFEVFEFALLIEHLRIGLDGDGRVEQACGTDNGKFLGHGMGG